MNKKKSKAENDKWPNYFAWLLRFLSTSKLIFLERIFYDVHLPKQIKQNEPRKTNEIGKKQIIFRFIDVHVDWCVIFFFTRFCFLCR